LRVKASGESERDEGVGEHVQEDIVRIGSDFGT
jgi:hypothetical protein